MNLDRYALVEDGVVTGVYLARPGNPFPNGILVNGTRVSANWLYDGETFAKPSAPTPPAINEVSIRDIQLALNDDEIDTLLQSDAAPMRKAIEKLTFYNQLGRKLPKQRLQALLQAMVTASVLTSERGLEIYQSLTQR